MKGKYFGRERICKSFIQTDLIGKTLNIGAGSVLWLENDLFLGNENFISSDIDKNNLSNNNKALKKMVINAENIPFKDSELSQVIILDVLEHIKNDLKVIREIKRVLEIGGNLVICVPNDTLLSYMNPIRYTQHERHYKIKDLETSLKNNGFKIEKVFCGGRVFELINLYTHLFIKYTTGKIINLGFFDRLRDWEYRKHIDNGNEIAIKATKTY